MSRIESIRIGERIVVHEDELQWQAVRASGAGGQHVNKTSSAVVLRFDIHASSLPSSVRDALLASSDRRIGSDGSITIKAQESRSQRRNREAAVTRLRALIEAAATVEKPRIPTRPRASAVRKRLDDKRKTGERKASRRVGRDALD